MPQHLGDVSERHAGLQDGAAQQVPELMRPGGPGCTCARRAGDAGYPLHLSTATKWGIGQLDALTQLFTDGPWLPTAIRPG